MATKGGWSPDKGQYSACLYGRNLIRLKRICGTPAEKLASRDPTGARAEEAWQTVGGKGADF
ncbi:hypothetical protein [Peribacillus frigoritolerans]|uniref:hypothetical protein n=1 Tax=Peribacillus frigoritolerans TaxID=450367 RepID=UPI00399F6591